MAWVITGLGNPGEDYALTRHNAGRMAVEYFASTHECTPWKEDKKTKATVSKGAYERTLLALVLPDTFMNKSGAAVTKFVKSIKAAERLIVVYDDLDLPLGTLKISYDRGSGGHKGLDSVARSVKTRRFPRVRIGVSPSTTSGVLKKPQGEKEVEQFILGLFRPHELGELKTVFKRANLAIEAIIEKGVEQAMNEFN